MLTATFTPAPSIARADDDGTRALAHIGLAFRRAASRVDAAVSPQTVVLRKAGILRELDLENTADVIQYSSAHGIQ